MGEQKEFSHVKHKTKTTDQKETSNLVTKNSLGVGEKILKLYLGVFQFPRDI